MDNQRIYTALKEIIDLNKCDISINDGRKEAFITIEINISVVINQELSQQVKSTIENLFQDYKVKIAYSRSSDNPVVEPVAKEKAKKSIAGVANIIMVSSGKGGVGKSTIAANLAISMAKIGWRTALMDADIYGASIPTIFNIQEEIDLDENQLMKPILKHGVHINSIEFITKQHEALIWRGPMISKILNQLLLNTNWGEIDYLIIDTPPGTGDIHITLLENFQIDGYLLISTPHITSINNTKKTQNMFKKFNIKNSGLVFNMIDLFKKTEDYSIIEYEKKFDLPIISDNKDNLFALNKSYEKYFIEIARHIAS